MVRVYTNYLDPLTFSNPVIGQGCRITWRIPKGVNVIPNSIKVVNLSFTTSPSLDANNNLTGQENRFNSTMGIYEPVTYMAIKTASGCELNECRNVSFLAQILNCTGLTNDYVDGVKALEMGNPVAMSINSTTQQLSARHALNNRLYVNQGLYKMELDKFLPVLNAMGDIADCGFEIILEMNGQFLNSPNTSVASIVLQYDELRDYKHKTPEKGHKFIYTEYLPEIQFIPYGPNANSQNIQQVRFLTFVNRSVNKLIFNVTNAANNMPILLNPGTTNSGFNLYLSGEQFVPLNGIAWGTYAISDAARHLGGLVFPLMHCVRSVGVSDMDDLSISDILQSGEGSVGYSGQQFLAPIVVRTDGLKYNDLMVQISAYQTTAGTNGDFPNLNLWCFGEVFKMGMITDGRDFETTFL